MQQCYNRGCGQTFDPEKNSDESCRHHPGAPYFHDAYKGWSCCNKKSVDFTEFLSIKGCTISKHSNIKPPEPEKPEKIEDDNNDVIEVRAPIKASMQRPPIDTPMTVVNPTVAQALKEAIDSMKVENGGGSVASALAAGNIPVGTSCKNKGCTYSYTGTAADYGECFYHPGAPIFHEGMKYWSCCQRKTSDFTVFMSQKGCACGEHKWFKEDDDKQAVKCRYDWHQTPRNVIVSIYAKKYHYLSKIEVSPIRLHVNLVFPEQENAQFNLDLELRGIIDVNQTTAHMFGTKVEITMPKAEPGSWQKLDFPREKLPPPQKAGESKATASNQRKDSASDDDFNLDDIETVNTGIRLTDISGDNKNDLD